MQELVQPTIKVRFILSGKNYRQWLDPAELDDLREQVVAAGGVLEPILVRPHPTIPDHFEIIAGERRFLVAKELYGLDYDMPIVYRNASDAEARAFSIIENKGRAPTSAIEEAQGAADLLAYNAGDKESTRKQLGWKPEMLESRLLLLNCAAEVRSALIEKRIKLGHAELLAGMAQDQQAKVLAKIIETKAPVELLRKQLVGQFARKLSEAIFDTAPCSGCVHNSEQQAGLFSESIGSGYCQHPTHYDELTLAHIEAKAVPLRERFQIVKVYRAVDGFQPLTVRPDGEVGVGPEQYEACRACANFGCGVSAVPGTYGTVSESLCFDAQCHSQKVLDRRRAQRDASEAAKSTSGTAGVPRQPDKAAKVPPKKVSNQTPPRIVEYRETVWRKWAARQLMAQPERNHRVLSALIASRTLQAFDSSKFVEAVGKLVKPAKFGSNLFRQALEQSDAVDADRMPQVVLAVAACAAFGVVRDDLETLLTYLGVEESAHFTLSAEYLELLTVNELEALADELKLRKAMGDAAYKKAKSGTKGKFIEALLGVNGFAYAGAVPKAMRYSRKKLRVLGPNEPVEPAPAADGAASTAEGCESAPVCN